MTAQNGSGSMRQMSGMDTEEARGTSRRMDDHAAAVEGVLGSISAVIEGITWTGGGADRFRDDWNGSFRPQASGAASSLREQAGVLRTHADRQDQASS